jgi:hypothetical protein
MTKNRIFICTFSALLSGCLSAYVGVQFYLHLRSQKCQNQAWGLQEVCKIFETPKAIWQGSTAGLWTGTVLGAFFSGLLTQQQK